MVNQRKQGNPKRDAPKKHSQKKPQSKSTKTRGKRTKKKISSVNRSIEDHSSPLDKPGGIVADEPVVGEGTKKAVADFVHNPTPVQNKCPQREISTESASSNTNDPVVNPNNHDDHSGETVVSQSGASRSSQSSTEANTPTTFTKPLINSSPQVTGENLETGVSLSPTSSGMTALAVYNENDKQELAHPIDNNSVSPLTSDNVTSTMSEQCVTRSTTPTLPIINTSSTYNRAAESESHTNTSSSLSTTNQQQITSEQQLLKDVIVQILPNGEPMMDLTTNNDTSNHSSPRTKSVLTQNQVRSTESPNASSSSPNVPTTINNQLLSDTITLSPRTKTRSDANERQEPPRVTTSVPLSPYIRNHVTNTTPTIEQNNNNTPRKSNNTNNNSNTTNTLPSHSTSPSRRGMCTPPPKSPVSQSWLSPSQKSSSPVSLNASPTGQSPTMNDENEFMPRHQDLANLTERQYDDALHQTTGMGDNTTTLSDLDSPNYVLNSSKYPNARKLGLIAKQISIKHHAKGDKVVTQVIYSEGPGKPNKYAYYDHLINNFGELPKGTAVIFIQSEDGNIAPQYYGPYGATIDSIQTLVYDDLNRIEFDNFPVGQYLTRTINGNRQHRFSCYGGALVLPLREAWLQGDTLHPIPNHWFSFIPWLKEDHSLHIANIEWSPYSWEVEKNVLYTDFIEAFRKSETVSNKPILWVGELGYSDCPIHFLTRHIKKKPINITLDDVIDASYKYALVQRDRYQKDLEKVKNGELSFQYTAKEVENNIGAIEYQITHYLSTIAMIDDARNNLTQFDIVVNPKVFGLTTWTRIINTSIASETSTTPSYRKVHVITRVANGTNSANINYVTPIQERLIDERFRDFTVSRTLLDSVVPYAIYRSGIEDLEYKMEIDIPQFAGQRPLINTYGHIGTPIESPPVYDMHYDFKLNNSDDNEWGDDGDDEFHAVRVVFRQTDEARAYPLLKRITEETTTRNRLILSPDLEAITLPGYCHFIISVRPLTTDPTEDAVIAEDLANHLMKKEYGGIFMAMTWADFYSTNGNTVNILFTQEMRLDPGTIGELTRQAPCYPTGFRSVRIALKGNMVHHKVATRYLEKACKSFNKGKQNSMVEKQAKIVALFPIKERNNSLFWIVRRTRNVSNAWNEVAIYDSDVALPIAGVIGIPRSANHRRLTEVLQALRVPNSLHNAAKWAEFTYNHVPQYSGLVLQFDSLEQRDSFLDQSAIHHPKMGIIMPLNLATRKVILRGHAIGIPQSAHYPPSKVIGDITPPVDIERNINMLPHVPAQIRRARLAGKAITDAIIADKKANTQSSPSSSPSSSATTNTTTSTTINSNPVRTSASRNGQSVTKDKPAPKQTVRETTISEKTPTIETQDETLDKGDDWTMVNTKKTKPTVGSTQSPQHYPIFKPPTSNSPKTSNTYGTLSDVSESGKGDTVMVIANSPQKRERHLSTEDRGTRKLHKPNDTSSVSSNRSSDMDSSEDEGSESSSSQSSNQANDTRKKATLRARRNFHGRGRGGGPSTAIHKTQ